VNDKTSNPKIGVWHILPYSLSERLEQLNADNNSISPTKADFEQYLNQEDNAIVIYFHGNSFDRAQYTRTQMYNILSKLDFHVFAIDYRGYGDSSGVPSENILAEDAHAIYNYVRTQAPSKDIYVWGHSMGTGVAARLVAELSDYDKHPKALILESPFNNLKDVIRHHPLSTPFRWLPWFDHIVINSLMRHGLVMKTDVHLQRINCPILVLHAADDHIIPIKLGGRLVNTAREAKRDVTFVEFEAKKGYFHKHIYTAPELPNLIREFLVKTEISGQSKSYS